MPKDHSQAREFWRAFGSLLVSFALFEWIARREFWDRVRREREEAAEEPE